jgi:acyl-CoA synthetase (NDP forming)/GNAT superfamily N-acetyltransferase
MSTGTARHEVAGWEGLTSDGHVVRVRPVTPADEEGLGRLAAGLSDRTIYLRFFSVNRGAATRYLQSLAREGDADHDAVVAEVGGLVVAVAGWDRTGPDEAEVALLVGDDQQGRGIGMLLLEELRTRAERCGVRRLVADTLPENRRMLDVFGSSGLHGERRTEQGVTRSVLETTYDDDALALVDEREAHAERASLAPLLAPRSVAVIGAGRRSDNVGHQVLRSIVEGRFTGAVHAVNPHAFEVAGLPTYAAIGDVPAPVDLAVVAVPASEVLTVVGQCGTAGVRAAVVLTSGLGEAGGDGAALERQVLAAARRHDMRLVGPNCLGVLTTDPEVRLTAWFGRCRPEQGPLAVATQSGAVGISLVDHAARSGLGVAALVSLGNKVDVSGNDLLLAWWHDPRVRVVAMYLESFGNPRKFARLARRVSRTTPVLVVKGGRSSPGARAGRSHTAAAFTPDAAVDALCARAGVLRMDGVEQLVDAARLLASQPVPDGGRLAVVGNGGGAGVLAADAAAAAGLGLPSLSDQVRAGLPAGVDNPIDLGAGADPETLRRVLEVVAASGEVDALLVSVTATRANDVDALLAAAGAADVGGLPVVVNVVGVPQGHPELPLARGDAAPVYPFAETAVAALAAAVRYGRMRRTPTGTVIRPAGTDPSAGRALVDARTDVLRAGGWLGPSEVTALLTAYGVPLVPGELAATADEAVDAARRVEFPVVLKTTAAGVLHKTDVGGVRLDLTGPDEVRTAADELLSRLAGGVVVQPMVRAPVELVAGVTRADAVGPVAMVGLGGVWTDLLQDRAFGLVPLTEHEPAALLRSLRCAPVLEGFRGAPPVAVGTVEDLLLRLSALAADLPEVAELDLNPVLVGPAGVTVVDARVRLAEPVAVPDELSRHLRA